MKIETIPASGANEAAQDGSQVIQLKVTGPLDQNDAILKRARELVKNTGSTSMAESFEWALSNGVVTKK